MKKRILVIVGVLVLVAALAVPMAALAEEGTTDVSGDVGENLVIKAPPAISLGTMPLDWTEGKCGTEPGQTGIVITNHDTGFTLQVNSDSADGTMSNGTDNLTTYLYVNTGNPDIDSGNMLGSWPSTPPDPLHGPPTTWPSGVQVTTTPTTCLVTSEAYDYPVAFYLDVWQRIVPADKIGTGFSIILTYTATLN